MDAYKIKKEELEKNKAEAIKEYNFEGRDAADAELLKLEEEKAKFEQLSSTEIPQNMEDRIVEQGGTVEELNEKAEEVDAKIEEVKEGTEEKAEAVENQEIDESSFTPEQKYDKKVDEYNKTVDDIKSLNKELTDRWKEIVLKAGFSSLEEYLQYNTKESQDKIKDVKNGLKSEIILNDNEIKLYNALKDAESQTDLINRRNELSEKRNMLDSESKVLFNTTKEISKHTQAIREYVNTTAREYNIKVDTYSGSEEIKTRLKDLRSEMEEKFHNTDNKGFDENSHRFTTQGYEQALKASVNEIEDIKKEIDSLLAENK